jgi:hypothetical protein
MPEATFPFIVFPAPRTLPFIKTGTVLSGSTLIATNVPVSVWPAPGAVSNVGMVYDHDAEAPRNMEQILRMPNIRLIVDDVTYTVVDFEINEFIPHLVLRLRQMRAMI